MNLATYSLRTALISGLLVGSTLFGLTSSARAASMLRTYDAKAFKEGDHAFTLPKLKSDGYASSKDFIFKDPGTWIEWDEDDDNVADYVTLTGTLTNLKNDRQRFDVDLRFNVLNAWSGGTKGAGQAGLSNQEALVAWDFYEIDDQYSTLTGLDDYEGTELNIFNRASNYVAQVGYGANDKNKEYGASYWFGYEGTLKYTANGQEIANIASYTQRKADININLDPAAVPEPTAAVGLLAVGAMGVAKLKRQQQG